MIQVPAEEAGGCSPLAKSAPGPPVKEADAGDMVGTGGAVAGLQPHPNQQSR